MSCTFDRSERFGGPTPEEVDLHLALCPECGQGGASQATFEGLRRRLAADRPDGCEAIDESVTAVATGSPDPEAERHLAMCAKCRDRRDARSEVWRLLEWPVSAARFEDLRPRLLARPIRWLARAASVLLAAGAVWAAARPSGPQEPDGAAIGTRLSESGVTLQEVAALGTDRAARRLAAIGGPEADALLLEMLARNPRLAPIVGKALAGLEVESIHPADLVREHRPDLLSKLIDLAPPGSGPVILSALSDPRLADRAAAALARLPEREARSCARLVGLSATPEEAATLIGHPRALEGAIEGASRSRDHRDLCFWRALAVDGGVVFLIAAAGDFTLRDDALQFLDLLPEEEVAAACIRALRHPLLAPGAVIAALRLNDRRLVPELLRAAKDPPPGLGAAGFELTGGPVLTGRSLPFEMVCVDAASELSEPDPRTMEEWMTRWKERAR
jgi:hypothetical protein